MNPAELFRHDSDSIALPAGQKLFSEGDVANEMYVLLDGEADIIVGNTIVEHSRSGALLGEMALIEECPRTATVVTRTPCRFARITPKRFMFLVQQTPFFSIHVMKTLADRLRGMNQRLAA